MFPGCQGGVPFVRQALGRLHLLLPVPQANLAPLLHRILLRLQVHLQVRQDPRGRIWRSPDRSSSPVLSGPTEPGSPGGTPEKETGIDGKRSAYQ